MGMQKVITLAAKFEPNQEAGSEAGSNGLVASSPALQSRSNNVPTAEAAS